MSEGEVGASWTSTILTQEEFNAVKEDPLQLLKAVEEKQKTGAAEGENEVEQQMLLAVEEQERLLGENEQLVKTVQHLKESMVEMPDGDEETVSKILRRQLQELKSIHADALLSVQKRTQQCESLKGQLRHQESSYQELVGEHSKVTQQFTDLQAEAIQLRLAECREKQKNDGQAKHVKWLEGELENKTDELLSTQQELGELKVSGARKLEEAETQAKQFEELHDAAKRALKNVQAQLNESTTRITNRESAFSYEKTQLTAELATKQKLVTLYQGKAADAERELAALHERIEGAETVLTSNKENYEQELVVTKQQSQTLQQQLEEALVKVKDLEATRAKEAQIGELLLDAGTGATQNRVFLTEIATKYEEKCKELQTERTEHRKKSLYLNKLVAEVEAKTPLIQKQQSEFSRMKQEKDTVSKQLEKCLEELATSKESYREKIKDNYVVKQQLVEASKQVDTLLKAQTVQQKMQEGATAEEAAQAGNDLLQLRDQNEELKRKFAGLQYDLQQRQEAQLDERHKHAMEELEKQQKMQKILEARVASLGRDKNEYCQLYKQLRKELEEIDVHGQKSVSATPAPVASGRPLPSAEAEAIKQKDEMEREFSQIREDLQLEVKKTTQELLASREQLSNAREELAEFRSRYEMLDEKHNKFNENSKYLEKEVKMLRDQTARQSSTNGLLEKQLKQSSDTVRSIRTELSKKTSLVSQLSAERTALADAKTRLEKDCEAQRSEKARMEQLVSTMQSMQKSTETSRAKHVEHLEAELTLYKEESTKHAEKLTSVFDDHQKEINDLTTRLKERKVELHNASAALVSMTSQYKLAAANAANLKEQLKLARDTAVSTEKKIELLLQAKARGDDPKAELLASQLRDAEAKLAEVTDQLKSVQESEEMWKLATQESGDTVKDQASEIARIRADKQKADADAKQKIQDTEQEKELLVVTISDQESALASAQTKLEELTTERDSLATQLATATGNVTTLKQKEQELEKEVQAASEKWKSAQDKYQHEFKQRVEDMELYERSQTEVKLLKDQLQESESNLLTTTDRCRSLETEKALVDTNLGTMREELQSRIRDLEAQNNVLHEQLQDMAVKAQAIEGRLRQAQAGDASEADVSEPGKTPEELTSELRALVQFVRREKDIVQCKLELSEQELIKLRTQSSLALESVEVYRAKLEQAQKDSSSTSQTAQEHQELMQQLEQLNVVRESNVTLRTANTHKTEQLNRAKEMIGKLKARIEPLVATTRTQEAKIEVLGEEKTQLETDNQSWRERVQQLLSKYERIDPEEYRELQKSLEEATATQQSQRDELSKLTEELTSLKQQTSETSKKLEASIEEVTQLKTKLQLTETELSTVRGQLKEKSEKFTQLLSSAKKFKAGLLEKNKQLEATKTQLKEAATENEQLSSELAPLKKKLLLIRQQQAKRKNAAAAAAAAAAAPTPASTTTPSTSASEKEADMVVPATQTAVAPATGGKTKSPKLTKAKAAMLAAAKKAAALLEAEKKLAAKKAAAKQAADEKAAAEKVAAEKAAAENEDAMESEDPEVAKTEVADDAMEDAEADPSTPLAPAEDDDVVNEPMHEAPSVSDAVTEDAAVVVEEPVTDAEEAKILSLRNALRMAKSRKRQREEEDESAAPPKKSQKLDFSSLPTSVPAEEPANESAQAAADALFASMAPIGEPYGDVAADEETSTAMEDEEVADEDDEVEEEAEAEDEDEDFEEDDEGAEPEADVENAEEDEVKEGVSEPVKALSAVDATGGDVVSKPIRPSAPLHKLPMLKSSTPPSPAPPAKKVGKAGKKKEGIAARVRGRRRRGGKQQ